MDYRGDTRTSNVHRPRATTTPFLRSWKANPSFPLLTLFFAIPESSSTSFSFVEALSFFHSFIYLGIPPLFQLFATLRYCYLTIFQCVPLGYTDT
ncbi:hypothetical protein BDV37DRAFT_275469 [Aspergillus pseudonomiae]|uniref:Uncharacterized protein n=1 Tax=Aspergillus pseudonomiae TaxID=1506151 RepID=A0A5N7CYF2_9EURO|nr:uncharacterized protein BDV37DRAFT_275469 [Aspergillus pseudonomiae]KAE8399242.1 hypothetical protein BDV37DRAFT_275469 [Aspergillus pseudonomiae]